MWEVAKKMLPQMLDRGTFVCYTCNMDIKILREQLNWTQEKLAQELGVSVMTIRRWESGKHEPSRLALREVERLKESYQK